MLVAFATIWLYVWLANPDLTASRLSLTNNLYTIVTKNWGGNIVFYNNAETGPYTGGIISLTPEGTKQADLKGWGNNHWISFKSFIDKGRYIWTLTIRIWLPFLIFAILPFIFLVKSFKEHGDADLSRGEAQQHRCG